MKYPGLRKLYEMIIGEEISTSSIIGTMARNDEICRILDTLESESEFNQEVILRCWNGESMENIADVMGVSVRWITEIRSMICRNISEALNG